MQFVQCTYGENKYHASTLFLYCKTRICMSCSPDTITKNEIRNIFFTNFKTNQMQFVQCTYGENKYHASTLFLYCKTRICMSCSPDTTAKNEIPKNVTNFITNQIVCYSPDAITKNKYEYLTKTCCGIFYRIFMNFLTHFLTIFF